MAMPFDQREALRMLAGSPDGCTESILLTHGFGTGTLRELVRDGFATAERRTVRAGAAADPSDVADDHRLREACARRVGGPGWLRSLESGTLIKSSA
jgi:hypothetical protein